jgi:hypothetical protein
MAVENLSLASSTTYAVQIFHSRTEGIVASPIAGPAPQNCSLARLHAPMEILSVYWTAVRNGGPPTLPSSKSYLQNLNRVLLGGERIGVVTPDIVGHIWQCFGRYDYAVVGPEGLDSNFALAKCPWETADTIDFYIPASNFQTGFINTLLNSTGLPVDPDVPLLQSGFISP